jgi:hypothetical protein
LRCEEFSQRTARQYRGRWPVVHCSWKIVDELNRHSVECSVEILGFEVVGNREPSEFLSIECENPTCTLGEIGKEVCVMW